MTLPPSNPRHYDLIPLLPAPLISGTQWKILYAALLYLLLAATPAAPDTLVICPAEFRPALVTWEAYRRGQGHEILVIDPPDRPADLQAAIRRVAQGGQLKYLVLIGDVPGIEVDARKGQSPSAPTNNVPAKINTRSGSSKHHSCGEPSGMRGRVGPLSAFLKPATQADRFFTMGGTL